MVFKLSCYHAIRLKWNVQVYVKFYFDKYFTHIWRAIHILSFTFLGIPVYYDLRSTVFILWIIVKYLGGLQGIFICYVIPCPTRKLQKAYMLEWSVFVGAWVSGKKAHWSYSLISSFFGIYLLLSCLKGKHYPNESHKDKWLFQAVINFHKLTLITD